MPTPFDTWTADDALAKVDAPADYAVLTAYYDGDHYQGGAQWAGPRPQPDQPGYQEAVELIARAFVSKNAIKEVVHRDRDAVIGNEPTWSVTVRRPLEDGEQPTEQEAAVIDAVESELTAWWDGRKALRELQRATAVARLSGRALLRLYVPQGLLVDGLVPSGDLAAQLGRLYLDVIAPDMGSVYTDPDTKIAAGIVAYEDDEGQRTVELCYVDPDTSETVLRLWRDDEDEAFETRLPLGGRLVVYQLELEPIVTPQVRQLQNLLNMALTMLGRNVVVAGFLERIFLNAQMPGEIETDPATGKKVFKPAPLNVGAGATNVLRGVVIEDDDGRKTIATPSVVFRDPVPVDTFTQTREEAYRGILEECHQLHALIAGDATASGESRKQARTDFEGSIKPVAREVEAALRWLLETALAMAGHFAGMSRPGAPAFADYRATATCRIDTGPLSADELRVAREMTEGERPLWSQETGMARTGIDDTKAEQERIAKERADPLRDVQVERARLGLERDRVAAQAGEDPIEARLRAATEATNGVETGAAV